MILSIPRKFDLLDVSFLSITILWLGTILDPQGGLYNIKNIALISTFFWLAYYLTISGIITFSRVQLFYFIWFALFLPTYGLIISLTRGGFTGSFIDTSYISSSIFFLFTLIYMEKNLEFAKSIFVLCLRLLSLMILSSFLFALIGSEFNPIWFFVEHEIAFFGKRNFGPIEAYYIFFVSSPLLIFLIAYDCLNFITKLSISTFFKLLISFTSVLLTANRMNVLLSLLIIGFILIFFNKKKIEMKFVLTNFFLISAILIAVYFSSSIYEIYIREFSTDERLSYLSIYSSLLNNPQSLIFGQGYNAHAWSYEALELINPSLQIFHASKTELTYFEFIRVYGLINFLIFMSFFYYLLKSSSKLESSDKWLFIGLFFYLLSCFTNPNLFSIIFMLPLGLAFATIRLKV